MSHETEGPRFNRTPHPEDFCDPVLTRLATGPLQAGDEWRGINRKWWEWAMVLRAVEHFGYARRDCVALGVASGTEPLVFALTGIVRTVIASDLYGLTAFSKQEATPQMLRDPSHFWEHPFDRSRLIVQNCDATQMPFGDESFDVLFSCSSVEHFGREPKIVNHMAEALRVLRPGGMYALSVDYLYRTSQAGRRRDRRSKAIREFLTQEDVERLLVGAPGFTVREPVDYGVPTELVTNLYDIATGKPQSGEYLPHIWLNWRDHQLTSLFVLLFKDGPTA